MTLKNATNAAIKLLWASLSTALLHWGFSLLNMMGLITSGNIMRGGYLVFALARCILIHAALLLFLQTLAARQEAGASAPSVGDASNA